MEGAKTAGIDLEEGVSRLLVVNVQEEETLVHKANVLWWLYVQACPVRNVCGFCDLLMTALKLLVGRVGWGPFILSWVYGIFPRC